MAGFLLYSTAMASVLENSARRALAAAERRADHLTREAKRVLDAFDPWRIQPYAGMGSPERASLRVRVLEERGVERPEEEASTWENLRVMLHRYASAEIPGVEVRATWPGGSAVAETDEDGFAVFDLSSPPAPGDDGWATVHLECEDFDGATARTEGRILFPHEQTTLGVISDIDDTIVKTHATQLLMHWRTVLLENAKTRTPFAGLPALYRALDRGGAAGRRPFFYVSSSPWNLYDLFQAYLSHHDIPRGVMHLKDFGLDESKWLTGGHDGHKRDAIDRILAFYPQLRFLLFGDTGQRDAEIYRSAVEDHPERIAGVFLRDVSDDVRDREAEVICDAIREAGVPCGMDGELRHAAEVAREQGWIADDAVLEA